jgi:ribonuclease-3
LSLSSQSPQLLSLQNRLGYSFQDLQILKLALTHRSAGRTNNERLEFLGDSFVNHVIAQRLYSQFPKASEGQLTRLRSKLVRGTFLAALGEKYALGECLTLGVGERKSGGRHRASILADTVEAIAGAMLLDAGYDNAAPCDIALVCRRAGRASGGWRQGQQNVASRMVTGKEFTAAQL